MLSGYVPEVVGAMAGGGWGLGLAAACVARDWGCTDGGTSGSLL